MKTAVIIPARYSSTRFPGKPIHPLLGKPMVIWTAEIAERAVGNESVYVATDHQEIYDIVTGYGFQAIMTSKACLTGTDRVAEAAKSIMADIYINLQGDEPLVTPSEIKAVIQAKILKPECVINCYSSMSVHEDPRSVHIPKVLVNEQNKLIYMSRSLIPGCKSDDSAPSAYYKQVCIYAYNIDELTDFILFGRKSTIESTEDIEILRFFDLNRQIYMIESFNSSQAVDRPEDVAIVEELLRIRL